MRPWPSMPKRKRSETADVEQALVQARHEIFKALKVAKGLVRQQLAKRQRASKSDSKKTERIANEIAVLKSLDLEKTAHAHLCSALLRVKAVATCPELPETVKAGIAKPNLSDKERHALHSVTSSLLAVCSARSAAKTAVDQVVEALGVSSVSGKKGTGKRGKSGTAKKSAQEKRRISNEEAELALDDDDENAMLENGHDEDEERVLSQYLTFLGKYGDDESSDADEQELDPMEITDGEDSWAGFSDNQDAEQSSRPASSSLSIKVKAKSTPSAPSLPALVGGYISGSESASDVEVTSRKNRRGQRERRQIWEKKYREKARHLQRQQQSGGRDPKHDASMRQPWKKGDKGPFRGSRGSGGQSQRQQPSKIPTKRDDAGPLHPSWEAKKRIKEVQQAVKFQGTKITFA